MTNRTLVRVRVRVGVRVWIKIYIRVLRTWNDYLVLCILIATFLGDILLHIFQKEKIVTKNRPCSRGFRKTEKVLSASHKDTAVDIVRFYCTSVFEINFSGPLFTRQ